MLTKNTIPFVWEKKTVTIRIIRVEGGLSRFHMWFKSKLDWIPDHLFTPTIQQNYEYFSKRQKIPRKFKNWNASKGTIRLCLRSFCLKILFLRQKSNFLRITLINTTEYILCGIRSKIPTHGIVLLWTNKWKWEKFYLFMWICVNVEIAREYHLT